MTRLDQILFVDDDASILESFKLVLHGKFDVHTANSAQEALEIMSESPFPVVVSDLKMANMNGIELLRIVKDEFPATVRILLTGHAALENAISAVNEGEVFRFLQKPCPADMVKKVLKDAIRQHQLIMGEIHLLETHRKLADAYMNLEAISTQQARLIATTSHDLRSPLTSVVGFVKLISKDLNAIKSDDEQPLRRINANLEIIRDESNRMLRLINELLDCTKPRTGVNEWITEEVALCNVIDKAHKSVLGRLEAQPEVKVEILGTDQCPTIVACFDKLMQVFVNLLDNAIKFTDKGTVTVQVKREADDTILVTIKDTGAGISPDRLPHIFEAYHSTDTDNMTSGLGLPICKQIIEHFKGSVDAQSKVGVGTTFMVRLPVV